MTRIDCWSVREPCGAEYTEWALGGAGPLSDRLVSLRHADDMLIVDDLDPSFVTVTRRFTGDRLAHALRWLVGDLEREHL